DFPFSLPTPRSIPRSGASLPGDLGQLGDVPPSAQGFDQKDGGVHPAGQEIDRGPLVAQSGALRGDDFEISHQSALVAVRGKRQGEFSGLNGLTLLLALLIENVQSRQVVLHLLEGGEDVLAISSYILIVRRPGLVGEGAAAAGIVKRLEQRRAHGEKVAGPGKPVGDRGPLKARRGA